MSADPQKRPSNGSAPDGGNTPRRYAPTTEGEVVPGILYEGMLSMMRTDVVDLSMVAPPKSKGFIVMWYTGSGFIAYLPTDSHVTILEMEVTHAREQFIKLLELGWSCEVISEDFKDVIFHHNV